MGVSTASFTTANKSENGAESEFYAPYQWCLNPFQSLDRLLMRLKDELESYSCRTVAWQQEESRINLFLLACAIHCTVADYPGPMLSVLSKLSTHRAAFRSPFISAGIKLTGNTVEMSESLRNLLFYRDVRRWQCDWSRCVELASEILLKECAADSLELTKLRHATRELAGRPIPERLRNAKMQLPSGFRSQDLTHHDVIALADAFDRTHAKCGRLAIVGVRTAGAYFAPLAAARLRQRGWDAAWSSIRPKTGLCHFEKNWVRKVARRAGKVLILDDHPETGCTLRLTIDLLEACGVPRRKMTVVVPGHEAHRTDSVLTGGYADVDLVTLAPQESFKHRLLTDTTLQPVLEDLLSAHGGCGTLIDDEPTNAMNRRLEAHMHDHCLVHVKRVYALRAPGAGTGIRRVLVKSVGWGWLGYHAYLAGLRLHEFVPQVYGLRYGMLFSEWIETHAEQSQAGGELLGRIADYTASRALLLSLGEDRDAGVPGESISGCQTLARLLSGIYPPSVRRLKMPAVWKNLKAYATPQPAYIDGNLGTDEWLSNGTKLLKVDYEHHGFGNPAPNVADEAFDLACAAQQMKLSADAERSLLSEFVRLSGDSAALERFVLYALVCSHLAANSARFHSGRALTHESARQLEAAHIEACNFLTYTLARFCAEKFSSPPPEAWSSRLFFMDVDGVFDRLGPFFAYPTPTGIEALATLNRHSYSVVLNTGRPVGHVRQYCSSYPLAGGIGEFGCVFVDAIEKRETVLIDNERLKELDWLRQRLVSQDGIYLDQTYEFALRAYQVVNGRNECLPQELIEKEMRAFPRLKCYSSPSCNYIVPAEADKGVATRKVMEMHSIPREATAAIGDSEMDLPMLDSVAKAYITANRTKGMVRRGDRRYMLLQAQFQRGLLWAVQDLTGLPHGQLFWRERPDPTEHILGRLLSIGDRTLLQHWMAALKYNDL